MQTVQLPTSTDQLLEQLQVRREFVEKFDVFDEVDRIARLREAGITRRATRDQIRFLASFDRDAELARLNELESALNSGVKTLQFA